MQVYTVRIVYKSGYTIDFEVKGFEIAGDYSKFRWDWYSGPKPMMLGADDIAAVYQISQRTVEK